MQKWPSLVVLSGIMNAIVENPFSRKEHNSVLFEWAKKPSTIAVFLTANAYVVINHFSHRAFVFKVYSFRDSDHSIHCGSGLLSNLVAVFQSSLLNILALGIVYTSFDGFGSGSTRVRVRDLEPAQFVELLKPWIAMSLYWVIWLTLLNWGLFTFITPEATIVDIWFLGILGILLVFTGGWIGLALPAVIARKHPSKWIRFLTSVALLAGCLIIFPQFASQLIHLDWSYNASSNLIYAYNWSTALALPYLGVMVFLFPVWWGLIRNCNVA